MGTSTATSPEQARERIRTQLFVGVPEVMGATALAESTVRRMIKAGTIPVLPGVTGKFLIPTAPLRKLFGIDEHPD